MEEVPFEPTIACLFANRRRYVKWYITESQTNEILANSFVKWRNHWGLSLIRDLCSVRLILHFITSFFANIHH